MAAVRPVATSSPSRKAEAFLFLLLLASFAYFHHPEPGWNVNSRLALTIALVERGTVRVDGLVERPDLYTEDVAEFHGHLYSDKVIGTSLLGVPAFAAVRTVEWIRGGSFPTPVRRYVTTLFSVGLLAAAAGVLVMRLVARAMGPEPPPWPVPFAVAALALLGTQLYFYATLFMSYLPAIFFVLLALDLAWGLGDGARPGAGRLLSIGLALGAAVLCEYTAAIACAAVGLWVAGRLGRAWWRAGLVVAGASIAMTPFFAYTFAVFGRLAIPYEFERNRLFREMMAQGWMGLGAPRADVLWLVTFHPYRGLFVHSPWLLAGLAGLVGALRDRHWRGLAVASLGVLAGYLWLNSAYYMWWGGWSFGPRHLAPAIPFLVLGVAWAWKWKPARVWVVAAGVWGAALHLVTIAVDPQPRDLNPFTSLPMLLRPDLGSHDYVWLFPRRILPMFRLGDLGMNAGRLAGLDGAWSVAPLPLLWLVVAAVTAAAWLRGARSKRETKENPA